MIRIDRSCPYSIFIKLYILRIGLSGLSNRCCKLKSLKDTAFPSIVSTDKNIYFA